MVELWINGERRRARQLERRQIEFQGREGPKIGDGNRRHGGYVHGRRPGSGQGEEVDLRPSRPLLPSPSAPQRAREALQQLAAAHDEKDDDEAVRHYGDDGPRPQPPPTEGETQSGERRALGRGRGCSHEG